MQGEYRRFGVSGPTRRGVSVEGATTTEKMGAVTTTADVNNDVSMVSYPTPKELATAGELVRAAQPVGSRSPTPPLGCLRR